MRPAFKFKDVIYNTNIIVYIGNATKANAYVERYLWKDDSRISESSAGSVQSFNLHDGSRLKFIHLSEFPKTVRQISTLVHELNHVAMDVVSHVGVDDEEAYCYYHDYLFNMILPELQKEKKKCSKNKSTK